MVGAEAGVQDWKQTEHVLVQEADCSTWRTSLHLEVEVVLQIWVEVVLLVGMGPWVELVLDGVQSSQLIFGLAGALAELLVRVLQERFEGFLIVSLTQPWVEVVGEVPYFSGFRFHSPERRLLALLAVA